MTPRILHSRRVLLISPQPWDHLPISKHHYAEELAENNDVVFLEPPGPAGFPSLELRAHPTLGRLKIGAWRPLAPKWLRFHAYSAYRALMRRNAAWLTRRLGGVDIVWCFDFNVFPDLDAFGAQIKIFHPVDPLNSDRQVAIGDSADLVVSVSERILSSFAGASAQARSLLVNHGLSGDFADLARSPAPQNSAGPIRCGYFGNLDRPIVNFDLLESVARAHPEVQFHFWGPFRADGLFAAKLAPLSNVVAHGTVEKATLAREAAHMDLFVLAYVDHQTESDRSNAHKILEYMSTGRPIVATRMDCYADDPDLIRMSRAAGDADFLALFAATVSAIASLNEPGRVAKRKAFCQRFTYRGNIEIIDAALAELQERAGAK